MGSSGRQRPWPSKTCFYSGEIGLLPFLGEKFSTRDSIYEGKESGEWVPWAERSWKQTPRCRTHSLLQPSLPLLAITTAVGAPARPPEAQHLATRGLHPGAWEPSSGPREAKGRSDERLDLWACPSVHLLAHSSPVHVSRLLQLTPCILRSTMVTWAVTASAGVRLCPLSFLQSPLFRKPFPVSIHLPCLTRYRSFLLFPCLSTVKTSITDPGSFHPPLCCL